MRLAHLSIAFTVAACHGAPGSPASLGHRGGEAPAMAVWCPEGGVHQRLDLDGDGRDDDVYLVPDAEHVTCLEVNATNAPPLRCGADGDSLIAIELDDHRVVELPPERCDPAGSPVTLVRQPTPPPPDPSGNIPTGRTFQSVLAAAAAPSGTALWIEGGDAFAAIVWRGGWRWFVVGA